MPKKPTPKPSAKKVPRDETKAFLKDGCIAIDDAFDPQFVAELQAAHTASMRDWKSRQVVVGGLRFMISFDLKGAFLDPRLYLNPRLWPLIQSVLGKDCILDNVTTVIALPGAPTQHIHKDGSPLFDDATGNPLPCHALTLVVPLVDLTEQTGTTALFPGTQKTPLGETAPKGKPMLPYMKVGGAYLMDYRLIHQGTANIGKESRPILYVVYARPWFTDFANFTDVAPLRVSAADVKALPGELQWLFARPMIAAAHARASQPPVSPGP